MKIIPILLVCMPAVLLPQIDTLDAVEPIPATQPYPAAVGEIRSLATTLWREAISMTRAFPDSIWAIRAQSQIRSSLEQPWES
jgi:hypothetical protein